MFDIFKTKRVRIENKFFEKTINISIKIIKKLKWKKIETKNDADIVTTIENKYEIKLFMNCLMIAIVQKQCVERLFKSKNKNKNKIY